LRRERLSLYVKQQRERQENREQHAAHRDAAKGAGGEEAAAPK
jgi:hypothetical protein